MTDGIIQKVFNRYIECGEFKSNYVITNRKLIEIQQELIAEIKKACSTTDNESCFCSKLIGDNQE